MMESREDAFRRVAAALGHDVDAEIKVGGNYTPFVVTDGWVHVSGQISRRSDGVVLSGRAGEGTTLAQAQSAAKFSALRALSVLRSAAEGLERVRGVPHVTVFTQCSDSFTQLSEVADAASEVIHAVLGDAGRHTRTSIGVYQLPKGATVELELVASLHRGQTT
jgi:enamine deaminase RidA (YjgF/YER057c/UK114 family)